MIKSHWNIHFTSVLFSCAPTRTWHWIFFTGCTLNLCWFRYSQAISSFVLLRKCCQHTDWQTHRQPLTKTWHSGKLLYILILHHWFFWFSASSQRFTRHVICIFSELDCAWSQSSLDMYTIICGWPTLDYDKQWLSKSVKLGVIIESWCNWVQCEISDASESGRSMCAVPRGSWCFLWYMPLANKWWPASHK